MKNRNLLKRVKCMNFKRMRDIRWINLDQMDGLDMGGAATSEVQIIKSGEKMFFFKQEERLESTEDDYTHTYVENCTDEKDKQIYTELNRIVRNRFPAAWRSILYWP